MTRKEFCETFQKSPKFPVDLSCSPSVFAAPRLDDGSQIRPPTPRGLLNLTPPSRNGSVQHSTTVFTSNVTSCSSPRSHHVSHMRQDNGTWKVNSAKPLSLEPRPWSGVIDSKFSEAKVLDVLHVVSSSFKTIQQLLAMPQWDLSLYCDELQGILSELQKLLSTAWNARSAGSVPLDDALESDGSASLTSFKRSESSEPIVNFIFNAKESGALRSHLSFGPLAPDDATESDAKDPWNRHSMGVSNIMSSSTISTADQRPALLTNTLQKTVDDYGVKMINDYCILDEIGRGAFGKVKLAFDSKRNIKVAIKITVKPAAKKFTRLPVEPSATHRSSIFDLVDDLPGNRKPSSSLSVSGAVQREIAVMKKLRHKNIVSLYEVIDDPEAHKLYIVMQYIDNGAIGKVSSDFSCTKVCPFQLQQYALGMLAGLQYLHARGVIHRDIKPENILVNKDGDAFLADFGVSEILDNVGIVEGRNGTALFLAPELLATGRAQGGKAVDMWAVGVTLFALLVGRLPFQSTAAISNSDAYPAFDEVPKQWVALLRGLLHPDPKERFSAGTARRMLKRFRETPTTNEVDADISISKQQVPVLNIVEASLCPVEGLGAFSDDSDNLDTVRGLSSCEVEGAVSAVKRSFVCGRKSLPASSPDSSFSCRRAYASLIESVRKSIIGTRSELLQRRERDDELQASLPAPPVKAVVSNEFLKGLRVEESYSRVADSEDTNVDSEKRLDQLSPDASQSFEKDCTDCQRSPHRDEATLSSGSHDSDAPSSRLRLSITQQPLEPTPPPPPPTASVASPQRRIWSSERRPQ